MKKEYIKLVYFTQKNILYGKKDKEITLTKILKVNYKGDYHSWHLDLMYNKQKKLYELITCAYLKKGKQCHYFIHHQKIIFLGVNLY